MHICMIAREFPPASGGIGYYVYNLSKSLIRKGNQVTVVSRGSVHPLTRETLDGIEIYRPTFFPTYPFHLALHGRFVNSLLRSLNHEFDLLHLHLPLTPLIKTRLPIVTTVHTAMKIDSRHHEIVDVYSLAERIQSAYFSPFEESRILNISDLITAVSPSVATELEEYGVNSRNVRVMWNGVDEKLFCPSKTARTSGKYVLYTGVLRARKGLFDLVQAAFLARKAVPEIKFIVCGTGSLFQKLNEQVRDLGLEKQVIFVGHVSRQNLVRLYQNAVMQVIPSLYEGLPTVLLEAMACGLPIVATNIGGNRDIISHAANGLLFQPNSPEEMAKTITMLWANESLREKMGQCARRTVLEKFTWDIIASDFMKTYDCLF